MLVTHGMPAVTLHVAACASHPNNLGSSIKKKIVTKQIQTQIKRELVAPSWERCRRGKLGKGDEEAQSAIKTNKFSNNTEIYITIMIINNTNK